MPNCIDLLQLKPGDLLLTRSSGFASWLQRNGQALTNGRLKAPYSHASLYLGGLHIYQSTVKEGVAIAFLNPMNSAASVHNGKIVLPFKFEANGYEVFDIYRHPQLMEAQGSYDALLNAVVSSYGGNYARAIHFFRLVHERIALPEQVEAIIKKFQASKSDMKQIENRFCSELVSNVMKSMGHPLPYGYAPTPSALAIEKLWGFVKVDAALDATAMTDVGLSCKSDSAREKYEMIEKIFKTHCHALAEKGSIVDRGKRIEQFKGHALSQLFASLELPTAFLDTYSEALKQMGCERVADVRRALGSLANYIGVCKMLIAP